MGHDLYLVSIFSIDMVLNKCQKHKRVFAGPLKWVLGGLFRAIALNYGWDILDALIQKKGLNITWKKSRWGFYYGIDVSVE